MATDTSKRVDRHRAVSGRLSALDDGALTALLGEAVPAGTGIGGATARLTVEGVPVFVKRVPLTDLERRPEHIGATRNLFELPMFYQYGIGSTGFGTWREVTVHRRASEWVLTGRYPGFPILYHWRMLPLPAAAPMTPAEVDHWVAWWAGSPRIRDRLTAISASSASVVLFLEHLPYPVDRWLTDQAAGGDQRAESAYRLVDRELRAGVAFLSAHGMLHFDAHFQNLLTDGQRIYFADFGLSLCPWFDLTAAEHAFLRQHRNYDRCYTVTHLTHRLLSDHLDVGWPDRRAYLRANIGGGYRDLPPGIARIVAEHAPIAIAMGDFFVELERDKAAPYPAAELDRALGR